VNEGARLSPALAPVGEVLTLADSFALCVVTGPRDHRDSVYLRLTSSLAGDFELVRHRLDRDGLEFFDVLTGGDGLRPRVVFMSGLERMSDASRMDAIVRLNLLRDSWAPHPARVILWLPAWGLGEFRRLAPDLFHWRSCLVALHDADLPIRTQTEYLVWACERYGGARDSGPSPVDAVAIRGIAEAHRDVYTGYSELERAQVLRTVTRAMARARLVAADPGDLDVTSREDDLIQFERSPRLPLLLHAADLAGRLGPDVDWRSVVRAAGIPMIDPLITLLSRGHQRVHVLLDSIDRLDLSPGSPGGRLVAWLEHQRFIVSVAAFVTDGPPPALAGWTPRQPAHETTEQLVALGLRPENVLSLLLYDLFRAPGDNMHLLIEHLFGPEVARLMAAEGHDPDTVGIFLKRHALVDATFFEQLKALRPLNARQIDVVARSWFATPGP